MAPAADEPEHGARSAVHLVGDAAGQLLCRIAERDFEAYEILYRRYARSVYGLALRRLRDRRGAGDATRRAFEAIWRAAPTYVLEAGDGTRWVFTVAESTIVGHAHAPSPESAAEHEWPIFRVHAAVAELPEQERVPLELACWEGRSQSEIAEQLGLPVGTVTTRTRSALARLATRLEGH